jgi:hypothetical protein
MVLRRDRSGGLRLPLSPLAESALEFESEDKAGPWGQFTPSHLDNFDGLCDPDRGSDADFDNAHGDWLNSG